MVARLFSALAVSLVAGAVISGCGAGDVIDPNKTEIALRFDVREATGEPVREVTCPSDVPVSIGNRFTCLVVAQSGDEAVAELEVTSERGDLRVLSLTSP